MRRACVAIFVLSCAVRAQNVITTFAGTDAVFPADGSSVQDAPLGDAPKVSVDANGKLYIVSASYNLVIAAAPGGSMRVVAGNGLAGFSGEGAPATEASFNQPADVVADLAGNLYIADSDNNRVRRVEPLGAVRTFARGVTFPTNLALDSAGNLYVSQYFSHRISRIAPDGTLTTVAGTGVPGFSGDGGPAAQAQLKHPYGIAIDTAGNLYIADLDNLRVRKVTRDGIISTFAGNGQTGPPNDGGPAAQAALEGPAGVAVDAAGNVYITETDADRVRKVAPNGVIAAFAGIGSRGFSGDGGPAVHAQLAEPTGIAADSAGNVYIADVMNRRIRAVGPDGIIRTVAGNGNGRFAGDGGPPALAVFDYPTRIAFDRAGALYISDTYNSRVRKITADGVITTIATVDQPYGLAVDGAGNVYVADRLQHAVRRIAADSGAVSTVAGTGDGAFNGDNRPARDAALKAPEDIALDAAGNLYIADRDNHRIRKVDTRGIITTVAGNGRSGFSGDGGRAAEASLSRPAAIALDAGGNLYIADTGNQRVRRVDAYAVITTVAGNGKPGYSGDGGPAIAASLANPSGIALDTARNLYIADEENNRVRVVTPNGMISTLAGGNQAGHAGDGGPSSAALLAGPQGVAVGPAGAIFIADTVNNRIRAVLSARPSFSVSEGQVTLRGKGNSRDPLVRTVRVSSSLPGLLFSASATTTGGGDWLHVSAEAGAAPGPLEIRADPGKLPGGAYNGTVMLTAPSGAPVSIAIPVTLELGPADPPRLVVEPDSLQYSFVNGSGPEVKGVRVSNAGGGAIGFTAVASTDGRNWLKSPGGERTASAAGPVAVRVTADPAGLGAGVFSGKLTVTAENGDDAVTVPITVTITESAGTLAVSPAGLVFTAVDGGAGAGAQSIDIANTGHGILKWAAASSAGWLKLSAYEGSAETGAPGRITVSVDPGGLPSGSYYATVSITAPEVPNSPQLVAVVLTVAPQGTRVAPLVTPSRLIFRVALGDTDPGSQSLIITNVTSQPIAFSVRRFASPEPWFVHSPLEGIAAPGRPARVVVQPTAAALRAGVHQGSLDFRFSDGSFSSVDLLLVVLPGGSSSQARSAVAGCTPARLLPQVTSLAPRFSVPAAWPTPIHVQVVDDCANPVNSGSVVATFSTGDPPLALNTVSDGRWSATWLPRNPAASEITATISAEDAESGASGTAQLTGTVSAAGADAPIIALHGVANIASDDGNAPVAPNTMVSISGARLATGSASSESFPLGMELAGASVLVGGMQAPLRAASEARITAILPAALAPNTTHQVIVVRGNSLSLPQPVVLAAAQPAIFRIDGGGLQGMIYDAGSRLVDSANPAGAGTAITIFATGLGATDPAVPPGAAAPSSPLVPAVQNVGVTIAQVAAPVSFAGLAPGLAGVYQVNATVPEGLPAALDAPVVITAGGRSSPPVTMATR